MATFVDGLGISGLARKIGILGGDRLGMAIALFASELNRFLSSEEPEVLCITGRWGVGKTFAWNHYLKKGQESKTVKLTRYSYVSLFGRNSLDDVRTAIVENAVDSRVVGKKPSLESFESLVTQATSRAKKIPWLASFVPGATGYAASANRVLFLMMRDQIVCIDDLERAGSGLDTMDILGLVSSLKMEKSCKVIIILNDEFLSGANDIAFKTQLEKVADTVISFQPTPKEAAEIGIDKSNTFHEWLAKDIQTLGMVNIRVIKKIERFCRRVQDVVAEHDPRVLNQASHTLALAGYAKFQPKEAPPLEFIKSYGSFTKNFDRFAAQTDADENNAGDPDRRHGDLLRNYEWGVLDEFDAALIDGIERGLFDEAAIKRQADELQKKLQLTDKNNSYEQAWKLFNGSFRHDQETVLNALIESVKTNFEVINPASLSQTITFLKEFGREDQAKEELQIYVDKRKETAWRVLYAKSRRKIQ